MPIKTDTAEMMLAIDGDLRNIARYDHSVSVPSLGSLFHYDLNTPLGKAQKDAARIYGVPFAYPSTNGTTALNVQLALTLARPGEKVLIQRDSHVSILAPIIHAGLRPIYLVPGYSQRIGLAVGITPDDLRSTLDQHPDLRLVFLTYPNYFGIATDIRGCVEAASERGVPLIVDSAHGAHWTFHRSFPVPAERVGATVVTQSTHKTCPALGQGSLALFNDERLVERFYEVVNQLGFVSTSFSYVILLALFRGLSALQETGHQMFGERLDMSHWARQEINRIDGLHCFGEEESQPGFIALDPLRLTVDVSDLGLTGYEVEEIVLRENGHYAEMATIQNVLFLITPGTDWRSLVSLVDSLRTVAKLRRPCGRHLNIPPPALPKQILTPRDAFYSGHKKTVSADSAIGAISAETISAFPPGSAVIVAGEEVTQEVVDFLKSISRCGGVLKGASTPDLRTLRIIES
jgi:arginine decarboxylase